MFLSGPFHKGFVIAGLLLLAGCAGARRQGPPPLEDHTVQVPANAGVYKVGNPYQIDNVWYYPREQPDYDETGIASWYGPDFYGKYTANGELYDGGQLTAAHRTLPMPVNVRSYPAAMPCSWPSPAPRHRALVLRKYGSA